MENEGTTYQILNSVGKSQVNPVLCSDKVINDTSEKNAEELKKAMCLDSISSPSLLSGEDFNDLIHDFANKKI